MKTNANDSISPIAKPNNLRGFDSPDVIETTQGLSKREYFASLALSGLSAEEFGNVGYELHKAKNVAIQAVMIADALIEELNRVK